MAVRIETVGVPSGTKLSDSLSKSLERIRSFFFKSTNNPKPLIKNQEIEADIDSEVKTAEEKKKKKEGKRSACGKF